MKTVLVIGAVLCALPFAASADTVRPAVGKPLQQAEALISQRDYPAALLKVAQAQKVSGPTKYESLLIAQVRGAAAAGEGDYAAAAAAYQAVLASGAPGATERLQITQAIAGFYYQARDYPQAAAWVKRYIAAGGADPRTRVLLAQSYYQSGDFADAEQAAWRDVSAAAQAGPAPPESELQLLANSASRSGDQQGYRRALETLLKAYPSPAYWAEAIALVTAAPDFSDRLMLDVDRLRLATGTLGAPAAYEDYTERAILAGRGGEAKFVIDQGFSKGILDARTDAGHAARLQNLVARDTQPAPPPPPDDPLAVGAALVAAGAAPRAIPRFESVPSYADPDGHAAAQLARLWVIRVEAPGGQ